MEQIPAIKQVPGSDNKRPPLPINDTKIPVNEQIPDNTQKRKK